MRFRTFLVGFTLALVGCYESHSSTTSDAAPSDARARVDALRLDASFTDGVVADAEVACPGGLVLVDSQEVEWTSVDCGTATHPKALAVSGRHGPFQLVITENRLCDDRPGVVWARPVTIEDGRLQVGPTEGLGYEEGPAHVAANGDEFAACSGAGLRIRDASGSTHHELLREPPLSLPGCPQGVTCNGLAHDGSGWAAIWQRFECDVSLPEISRSGERGGLREEPFQPLGRPSSIATAPYGFASLSQGRDALRLYSWRRESPAPTVLEMPASTGFTALTAWPYAPGAWAIVSVDESTLRLRVVDEDGGLLLQRDHNAELMGYAPISVRATSASFGVLLGIGYGWTGGRVDAGTRFMVFGENGDQHFDDITTGLGYSADAPIDVAASEQFVLVHREGPASVSNAGRTEALLFACR